MAKLKLSVFPSKVVGNLSFPFQENRAMMYLTTSMT